ncbi:HD domain-containing protein [Candidatus Peregrinibacteria bacterium]|nr:HD domain-containing protein [Candidatus Peregrinibacteria bacterium]
MPLDYASLSNELSPAEVKDICEEVASRQHGMDTTLSEFATSSDQAYKNGAYTSDTNEDPFNEDQFAFDSHKIVFSKAARLLMEKTQSVVRPNKDQAFGNLTTRGMHVFTVASNARKIALSLGANTFLAEAIARAHDLGHPPFGHVGEAYLTRAIYEFGQEYLNIIGAFKHNIQGVHTVDRVTMRRGEIMGGLNLTDQVRHGIASHDGEMDKTKSIPNRKIFPENLNKDLQDYFDRIIKASAYIDFNPDIRDDEELVKEYRDKVCGALKTVIIAPATLEACIVFMSDVLTYCPEDYEDMVKLGIADRNQLPTDVAKKLGTNGTEMMDRLLKDLIIHSYGKDGVFYSKEVGELLNKFKREFLYPRYYRINQWIYSLAGHPSMKPFTSAHTIRERMNYLFRSFYTALDDKNKHASNPIVSEFLSDRDLHAYLNSMPDDGYHDIRAVIDYVSGCTDGYFLNLSEDTL